MSNRILMRIHCFNGTENSTCLKRNKTKRLFTINQFNFEHQIWIKVPPAIYYSQLRSFSTELKRAFRIQFERTSSIDDAITECVQCHEICICFGVALENIINKFAGAFRTFDGKRRRRNWLFIGEWNLAKDKRHSGD